MTKKFICYQITHKASNTKENCNQGVETLFSCYAGHKTAPICLQKMQSHIYFELQLEKYQSW